MCGTTTSILGGGEENEMGSMEQAEQHVTGGGNEQLCRRAQKGLYQWVTIVYNFVFTVKKLLI